MVRLLGQQVSTLGQFQERHAFLDRAAGDAEEVSAVGFGEATGASGDVGGDREGGAVELIDGEAIAARESLGAGEDLVGEVDGFLLNDEFLEAERHGAFY